MFLRSLRILDINLYILYMNLSKYCKNMCDTNINNHWCHYGISKHDFNHSSYEDWSDDKYLRYENEHGLNTIGTNHIPQCRNLEEASTRCLTEHKYFDHYCHSRYGNDEHECNKDKTHCSFSNNKCRAHITCKNIK